MHLILKIKLALTFILLALFLYLHQQGGDKQLFMAGFVVWICGPLFLLGVAGAFVHKKVSETPVSPKTLYLNLLGLLLVIIFAVRSSFGELI